MIRIEYQRLPSELFSDLVNVMLPYVGTEKEMTLLPGDYSEMTEPLRNKKPFLEKGLTLAKADDSETEPGTLKDYCFSSEFSDTAVTLLVQYNVIDNNFVEWTVRIKYSLA